MKYDFLKKFIFSVAFITLLSASNHANAWSLFGSEKKDNLEKANQTYDLAIQANQEGRVADAMALLSDARGQYSSLLNEHPDYETEHVTMRLNTCSQQMQIIKDKIVSGEVILPAPDQIVAEQGNTTTTTPIDLNINKEENEGVVVKKTNSSTSTTTDKNAHLLNSAYSTNNPLANANDETRILLINSMLDSGKATDAIFHIDEIIEVEKENTSIAVRCLYVKALISVGNKTMAEAQLKFLTSQSPDNPSVISLAAALAVANGDPMEALLQLDKIIKNHPQYAEVRINYAYILLMMDPAAYREAAIDSYKIALSNGAKRDTNLERNLNIIMK